jgi:hypothetical protein
MEKGGPIVKRMTYQQLEVIRERARALGMEADYEQCAVSPNDPCLSIRPVYREGGSITYYLDRERLTFLQAWGPFAEAAAEIEAVHATLTADFIEPPQCARCYRCGAVLEGSERLCARCESELAGFWASAEAPL